MKKILFPTDFSPASMHAFVYALHLAKNIKGEIIVLHNYEMPIVDTNFVDVPIYRNEVYEGINLINFENFKDQIPALRKIADTHHLGTITIKSVLLEGDLVSNMLQLIEDETIDYVVMANKTTNRLEALFIGSATASIMSSTKAIVLGIPEETLYEPIKKIAFTTQFTTDDFNALNKVIEIAKPFDAQIDCLYVKTSDSEVNELILEEWKINFKDKNIHFHVIESDAVEETIIDFISIHKINMLAILNIERGFFEGLFHKSLTKELSFHLKIPLLALHSK
jgi:nucleotide-binding universal stress UspA family protein